MKPYLLVYNLSSALLWGYVFAIAVSSLANGDSAASAWKNISRPLLIVQTLACAEILHSIFRIVKSPLLSTLLQVGSRLVVLWFFTYRHSVSSSHWSLYLMVLSWSTVEVPRYLFYAVNLYATKVPFPLFWLRYSLFAVLYPTGISGELLQISKTFPRLHGVSLPSWYFALFLMLMYLPGSPFMFFHMVSQRKKSFKARSETKKSAPPSAGVEFPLDPTTNTRSTTSVNQGAFAASVAEVDKDASAACSREKNWRFGYAKHVVRNVEICCASNEQCVKVAKAGLRYIHNNFEFVLPTQKAVPVSEAMKMEGSFYTHVITGQRSIDPNFDFYIPYQKFESNDVVNLKGDALQRQLDKWVARGTIESDTRDAILNVARNKSCYTSGLKDKRFVLLGAGAAMGPLRVLLELGATVIAVDLDREQIWKRLVSLVRSSPGTMIIPCKKPSNEIAGDDDLVKCCGADLLSATPQIANWLAAQEQGKQLVIGGYAYLDSALFVRLAVAMDAIMESVLRVRKDAAIAFLCSPTDVFVTEDDCHDARKKALKNAPLWQKLLKAVLPKRMLVPNAIRQTDGKDGTKYSIVDGLVVAQGPNYALAKRIQHWRCVVAREEGHVVSTNIAPSTATASVVHNTQFAAAYGGMKFFKPMEVVYQDFSNSFMTALLINDVTNQKSVSNPSISIGNHIRMFSRTSAHFGIWRMAFKCGSIGEVSAMIGYCRIYQKFLYFAVALFFGLVGFIARNGAPHQWVS